MFSKTTRVTIFALVLLILASLACSSEETTGDGLKTEEAKIDKSATVEVEEEAEASHKTPSITAEAISAPTPEPSATISQEPTEQIPEIESEAPVPEEMVEGLLVNTNANLRAGPGTDYAVVGNAVAGDILPFFGRSDNGWFQLDELGEVWIGSTLAEITSAPIEVSSGGEEMANDSVQVEDFESPRVIEGEIYNIDDVSFGNTKRYSVFVVVPYPITKEEVMLTCNGIVEDYKIQRPFNALSIFVSDRPINDVMSSLSIARCDYAPLGVWGEAMNVNTGDYSTHEFDYLFMAKMDDPAAALADRPTDEEVVFCSEWWVRSDELIAQGIDDMASEDMATEEMAQKHSMSAEQVNEILIKCVMWPYR